MINFINAWAQGIILAVIIATIIEIILPEGNNKKYVKTIIGIYIIFVIVHPLISKISSKNVNIEGIIENTTSQMNKFETNNITIENDAYIEETYKKKIEEDITKNAHEKGYNINTLSLIIETENDEEYGQIMDISMQMSKIEEVEDNKESKKSTTNNTIDNIQNVEIKISNNSNENRKNDMKNIDVSEEEIQSFKEYLNSVYGISKEKIHINE